MNFLRFLVCGFLCLCTAASAQTNSDFTTWAEDTLWPRARAEGISRQVFQTVISGVTLDRTLPGLSGPSRETTQSQAEFRHPIRYFDAGSLRNNTQTGQNLARTHATALNRVEAQTGVPGHIILAIWGRESSYGRAAIPHPAFDILATHAFLGRRSAYFTDELVAAMQIVERGDVAPSQLRSSWAGALGQPQFMPSSYLQYAADGDGDGRRDIWTSEADTFASIGGYLQSHGWAPQRDWGFEVVLPDQLSCTLEGPDQGRTIAQWEDTGIVRANGRPFPDAERREPGYLLLPAGLSGPAFLVTDNFYVLKDYNESDAYALFVGHVGDRIAYGSSDFRTGWQRGDTLPVTDVLNMQNRLIAAGHDVGGADGLVGFKTRRSIGRWQEANGQAATCYPSRAIVRAIR